jgi:cell division septal protein FtsQ
MDANREVIRKVDAKGASTEQENSGIFAVLFGLLGVFVAGIIIVNSSLFTAKRVVVKGNRKIPVETIVLAGGFSRNRNIFTINYRRAIRSILRNPYLARAQLSVILPDKIVVTVVERRPFCLIARNNIYYRVAGDGAVLGVADVSERNALPVLQGIPSARFQVGSRITAVAMRTALDIWDYSDRILRRITRRIDLKQYRLYLQYPGNPQIITVELGSPDHMAEKIANLRAVLAKNQDRDTIGIDLRVPGISTITASKNKIP